MHGPTISPIKILSCMHVVAIATDVRGDGHSGRPGDSGPLEREREIITISLLLLLSFVIIITIIIIINIIITIIIIIIIDKIMQK